MIVQVITTIHTTTITMITITITMVHAGNNGNNSSGVDERLGKHFPWAE